MSTSTQFLRPSDAARQLGVSVKALRLYEKRGLIAPMRTAAGWRVYGPNEIARVLEIVAFREMGLSLGQAARMMNGDPQDVEPILAAHQATLEVRIHQLSASVKKVQRLRTDLGKGQPPAAGELARRLTPASTISIVFDLPWPWGGEQFELRDIRQLNYIIGPLGSGKTRLAKRIAETLPNATFVGLDRLADDGSAARAAIDADAVLRRRVDHTLAWLVRDGASRSEALVALLACLEAEAPATMVVDMLEQGLDQATQEALIVHLRRRGPEARPLFILTRSSAVLNLNEVGADEAIILCPANHSPPTCVAPYRGTPGYEAVATCLASPEVRARTEGVIAWRPRVA